VSNEPKYEVINILVKLPAEGDSWYDRIFDLITSTCEEVDWDNVAEDYECPCGMQSMGGYVGTLDGCYDHERLSEKWAFDVEAQDLKDVLAIIDTLPHVANILGETYTRLHKAAYWHEEFQAWVDSLDDEEEDE